MGKWSIILALVILFGLLMTGAYFVIKGLSQTGGEYGHALIDSRERGEDVGCALQLRNIYESLRIAAMGADGQMPESLRELYSPGDLHCPAPNGPEYVYIRGNTLSMSADNVLVYEPAPAHQGKCSVLRLGGAVGLLTPEELERELAKTRRVIAGPRR